MVNFEKVVKIRGREYPIKNGFLLVVEEINSIQDIDWQGNAGHIKFLGLARINLHSIQGIEVCINAEFLDLTDNKISDLKPIDSLLQLKCILFHNNQVSSLIPIEKLKSLEELYASNNNIRDLANIAELKKLRRIILSKNEIESIDGIANLTNLEFLDISFNKITKIDAITNLVKLSELYASNNKIRCIKYISGLIKLKYLSFSNNEIESINNLENLSNLEFLDFSFNKVIRTSDFGKMPLWELNLSNNLISEISGLGHLLPSRLDNGAFKLILSHNKIVKLDGIPTHTTQLYLNNNEVTCLDGIERLVKLTTIDFSNNKLTTFQGIEILPNLTRLIISDRKTVDRLEDVGERVAAASTTGEHMLYLRARGTSRITSEMLSNFISSIKEDEPIINIGTKRESKQAKLFFGYKFFTDPPINEKLNEVQYTKENAPEILGIKFRSFEQKNIIDIYLVQMYHSELNDDFLTFTRKFWDNTEKEILKYNSEQELNSRKRVFGLLDIIKGESKRKKIILFPENTLPNGMEKELIAYSKDLNAVIAGGIIHTKKDNKQQFFINKAIIVDGEQCGYQEKQTQVYLPRLNIRENIQTRSGDAAIKIFGTRFGNMAIFICKDFLRFRDIIPNWAMANDVEFILVPAFTGEVLPFYARMVDMFLLNKPWDFRVIFSNIGQYGASEVFSISQCRKIEGIFSKNIHLLDNFGYGKLIVHRTISLSCECTNIKHLDRMHGLCLDCGKMVFLL